MQGRELVVGVSGGVAAYKTAMLVSKLVQRGAGVTVVMTRAARRFVGPATFTALTGRPVPRGVFAPAQAPLGAHIELANRAELICVAPATANVLAKAAHGLGDDLLSTLLLTSSAPVLFAPAMNCDMWMKPAVQRNVETLRSDGQHFVGPETGWLSCRKLGPGRMSEPETILAQIEKLLG
ncbi:MAG: phosphopantothenoylcysteine decarboxylase [Planctomycetales bacterium]|nr:phosphopantothenoylcysteine decarboxylase [Planctomycetales bacterium]